MNGHEVAMLLIHEGKSPKSQWPLTQERIIIGRDPSCDIQIDERQISRQHAEIQLTPGGYTLRDLGSKNGTFLNGQPVSTDPQSIHNGDEIGIALCAKTTFVAEEATAPVMMAISKQAGIRMDLAAKRVWVRNEEINPPLSLAQYKLLELLYQNSGHVVSRDAVVSTVWSEEESEGVSEQAIDALARRLRERIAEIDPENKYVETVRGHGFRLNMADK
jgi:hypothetical protein